MGHISTRIESVSPGVRAAVVAVFALALVLGAYSNSFNAGFHLDDAHQITENPHIQKFSNVRKYFTEKGFNSSRPEADFYRPVTTTSFAVSYALGGHVVEGYHVFNFVLHLLSAMLVFLVVGRVLRNLVLSGRSRIPFVAALAFALHPVQTHAVTYISGRAVLLASLFSLSAFYCFVRFRERSGRGLYWGVAAPAFFMLGLLSKEMAAGIFLVMVLYDLVLSPRGAWRKPRNVLYHAAFAGCVLLYLAANPADMGGRITRMGLAPWEYLMSEAKVFLMYFRLMVLPTNQNADYALAPTRSMDLHAAVSFMLIAAAVYGLIRARHRRPAESFFGLWFFAALLPESSVLPITDVAVEYRLYLPSVGFIAAASLMLARAVRPPVARTVCAVVLAAFCLLSFNRNAAYANEYTYWSDVVKKSPFSARAHGHIAILLMSQERYDDAVTELTRAIGMDKEHQQGWFLYSNLGLCLSRKGDIAGAVEAFTNAIAASPGTSIPYVYMAEMQFKAGDNISAEKNLVKAIELNDYDCKGHMLLSRVYAATGRDALPEMLRAVECDSRYFVARYNLAVIHELRGEYADALREAQKTLELAGSESEAEGARELVRRIEGENRK